MAQFIKRRVASAGPSASCSPPGGGAWEKRFPALLEFLTLESWGEGLERVPGSLSVFVDQGQWKCCLSDRDAGLVAFVTASEPDGLLQALEKGLRGESLDWRVTRARAAAKRK